MKRTVLMYGCVIVITLIFIWMNDNRISYYNTPLRLAKSGPLILLYSPLVQQDGRTLPMDFDSLYVDDILGESCTHLCRFSLHQFKYKIANVVVHNIDRLGSRHVIRAVELGFRKPGQIWVMYSAEPPACYIGNAERYDKILKYANLFNWTWTFRLDSDIPFPFGRITKRSKPELSRRFDRFQKKTRMGVALISHCEVKTDRVQYIRQLIEAGLDVDVIGTCRKDFPFIRNLTQRVAKHCKKDEYRSTSEKCEEILESTYKFYLSFENSLCREYITEKFFRPASLNMIPVVRNGVNMSLYAPEGSYINVNDFESTKVLVEYLKKVGSNRTLYNSYFQWKPFYDVEHTHDKLTYMKAFCDLCRYTHDYLSSAEKKVQIYTNVYDWLVNKSHCVT